MPVRVSYIKQFLVLTLFLLVTLSVIEGLAYAYDGFNPAKCKRWDNSDDFRQLCLDNSNLIYHKDPLANAIAWEPNQHMKTININNEGFRGPEIQREKSDDTYRIFMVGGSTTFGYGASLDQNSIPAHLQEKFNQINLGKRVEVINAGIHGYTSNDEMNLVKNKLVHYDPDLVIIFDGSNDIFRAYNDTLNVYDLGDIGYIYRKYFQFYKTLDVINNIIDKPKSDIIGDIWSEDIKKVGKRAELWKNNMLKICETGNQNGFKTLILLQPFLGTGERSLTQFETKLFNNQVSKPFPNAITEYSFFADNINNLKNSCTAAFDLRNGFDKVQGAAAYFDKWHNWQIHNRIIANEIFLLALPLFD